MSKKYTAEEFIKRAQAVHGDRYDYSQVDYKNSKSPVTIICPDHGPFQQQPSMHLSGQGCPVCGKDKAQQGNKTTAKNAAEDFIAKARAVHGDLYDYSQVEYKTTHTKIKILCRTHGIFEQTPAHHLQGRGCPRCSYEERGTLQKIQAASDFTDKARAIHGDLYDYSQVVYENAHSHVTIVCPTHGPFQQSPCSHLNGRGCPKCGRSVSSFEKEIIEWLQLQRPDLTIRSSVRDVIPPKELDIYIPELKLGIEFNGTFWHSSQFKTKTYHQEKSKACAEQGVLLFHIHEHLWYTRKSQIKSALRYRLGLSSRRISARECVVKPIEDAQARTFCETNHISGHVPTKHKLGLFTQEQELVCVLTASTPRFNTGYTWELIRMCSLGDVHVRGGFGKLFAYFCRNIMQEGESVVSYAQADWSNGSVYHAIGMLCLETTRPGYVWAKANSGDPQILPRYRAQKHKLQELLGDAFDAEKTEAENMQSAGWLKVYNAGNHVYTYTKVQAC